MEELNQLVAAKLAEQQERAAAGAQVGQRGAAGRTLAFRCVPGLSPGFPFLCNQGTLFPEVTRGASSVLMMF